MTQAQIEHRQKMVTWNRLKRRAADAPHGRKKEREAELRAWVKAELAIGDSAHG